MRTLLLALTAALAACKPSIPPNASGQLYFKALNCGACHQIGPTGNARGGPDLTMVGFRKSAAWLDVWLKAPQEWRPSTMMPDPHLTDQARAKLVEYLSGLKGQDWGEQRPWNAPGLAGAERGHVLFAKAGCVTCHNVGGVGGYPNNNTIGGKIPALVGVRERYTREELKRKVMRGVIPEKADPKGPSPLIRMPPWGETLKDDELDAVVDYLWTLEGGAQQPGTGW